MNNSPNSDMMLVKGLSASISIASRSMQDSKKCVNFHSIVPKCNGGGNVLISSWTRAASEDQNGKGTINLKKSITIIPLRLSSSFMFHTLLSSGSGSLFNHPSQAKLQKSSQGKTVSFKAPRICSEMGTLKIRKMLLVFAN